MIRKIVFCSTYLLLGGMLLSGCGQNAAKAGGKKPVVVINKLHLSAEDLRRESAVAGAFSHGWEEPEAGQEPAWLSQIVERELLVQEAQRVGLHREPEFMLTIERFWKEALIKHLLDRKGKEIGDQMHVYEPEIEAYYKQIAEEGADGQPVAPLEELREEISRAIRQEKESEMMEKWIAELRAKANISINHEAVSRLEES